MRVRTTANYLSAVEMECTQENITYLQHACAVEWLPDQKTRARKTREEWVRWPDCPSVRYADIKDPKRKSYMHVSWHGEDGQKHRKCFTPRESDDPAIWDENCRAVAMEAQQFFEANHVRREERRS